MRRYLAIGTLATAIVVAASGMGLTAEVELKGNVLRVSADAIEASGELGTGAVVLKAPGISYAGAGRLLAIREGGLVSSLLDGGAERWLSDRDALAVQVGVGGQAATIVLVNVGGRAITANVSLRALGVGGTVQAAYDEGRKALVGPLAGHYIRPLEPGEVTVVHVAAVAEHPVYLGVAGAGLVSGESASWDTDASALSGAVPAAGETAELLVLAPPQPVFWTAKALTVAGKETPFTRDGVCVRAPLTVGGQVPWRMVFARGAAPAEVGGPVPAFTAVALSPRCVNVTAGVQGDDVLVSRENGPEWVMEFATLADTGVSPETDYTYTLSRMTWSGKKQALATVRTKTPAPAPLPGPPDVSLAELKPVKATNGWNGDPRRNLSIEDHPLRIRGKEYEQGMGVHAPSELVYDLKPEYKRFVAVVGVDDETGGAGSVTFAVFVDDREVARTVTLSGSADPVGLNVELPAGAKRVRLVVGDGGDGIGCDHGDWAQAGFSKK